MSDATDDRPGYPAERVKAFVDAVVAIAMTLLILPLLESVGAAGAKDLTAAEWLGEEWGFIILFVISFVIVAMFWMIHHRLFSRVERVTQPLIWLLMAWLITIVWLPVATALTGTFEADAVTQSLYVGSMALTSAISILIRLYLRAHPDLHVAADRDSRVGIAVDLSMVTLFLLALVVGIAVPALNYFALFLLAFTSPVERVYGRMLGVAPQRAPAAPG